jgi:hypothetical protein
VTEEAAEETTCPVMKYVPIGEQSDDAIVHNIKYFISQTEAYIKNVAQKKKPHVPRACIASDGETEIWRKGANVPNEEGWVVEPVQTHVPIAEAVDTPNYLKMFRAEDGSEVRDGQKFYTFNTPKTTLPAIEVLKTDLNKESWTDGDLSLANCDVRWSANARGPVRSGFKDKVHPTEVFEESHPISIEEEWKPPLFMLGPRTWVTKGQKHDDLFHETTPLATKFETLIRNGIDLPPITVSEEYHEPPFHPTEEKTPKMKKHRFNTVFPSERVKLGRTDSETVKNRPPNLPPIKPAF